MKAFRYFMFFVALAMMAAAVFVIKAKAPYELKAVRTGSMSPTIPIRSLVIVHEGHYQTGQVITFHSPDGLVTHRLVSINSDGTITTKGDANRTIDTWTLHTSDIVGGVVAAPRRLGYFLVYVRNPYGFMSLVCFAIVLWLVWSLATEPKPPLCVTTT